MCIKINGIARDKIMLHCQEVYGCEPGDVDNDQYIDGMDGGCGSSSGMTADEFHKSMVEAIKLHRM